MLRHSSQSINNLPNQQLMIQSNNEQQTIPIKQQHIRGLEHSTSMSSFRNSMYATNFDPISSTQRPVNNMPPLPPPRTKKKLNPNEVSNLI